MRRGIRHHAYSVSATLTLCLLAWTLATRPAGAQSLAAVSGTVADSSGAVLPGAHVVMRNTATNVEQSTVTNSAGYYAIVNVVPGQYSAEVLKDGFSTEKETGISLAVNQAVTFNFTLKVGPTRQSVTVTGEASEVQTSTAALGTVIASQPVNDLPLNGRNFTELLELTPGVGRVSVSQNSGTGGTTSNPIGQFTFPAVNGQRNRSNLFLLDGVSNLGGYTDTYNYQPVIDAIQDFKVQSHSDLPEYGQALGGTVSVVTRGGTNGLHGSALGIPAQFGA